jgi:hypothetical protein
VKLIEVWDFTARVESFYIKDGVATSFKTNKPYKYEGSISPECFLQGPVYTFFDEGSYYLNLEEYDGVPPYDPDVDIVLYTNERVGLMNEYYEKYSADSMRKQFPNAAIVGQLKELPPSFNSGPSMLGPNEAPRRAIRPERPINRIRLFNDCDFVNMPSVPNGFCSKAPYLQELQNNINKKITYTPSPLNVDYIFENYYTNEKLNSIFAYTPHQHHRRGATMKFADYISKKYKLPVYCKPLPNDDWTSAYLSCYDFTKLWSPHLYHFNLDSMETQPGKQCIQVASVGSINIGGKNDSHGVLYPDTATCDLDKLEEVFVQYFENENKRFEAIQYAWETANNTFSHDAVKKIFKKEFLS